MLLEKNGVVHPNSLWNKAQYGKDIIIANLDTGVWPESKSFNDEGFGPVPSLWKAFCQNDSVPCNRKLIGARYFNKAYGSELVEKNSLSNSINVSMVTHGGAVWDIFRRQDVSKLLEYLQKHKKEFRHTDNLPVKSVVYHIHDQILFLNERHLKQLKEEFDVEPWTFEQYLGEAVFIPAGCPHQVRNRHVIDQLRRPLWRCKLRRPSSSGH
ncbi:hypothetical protein U1Q18_022828 [Sarracenia purpurea var. burkii]